MVTIKSQFKQSNRGNQRHFIEDGGGGGVSLHDSRRPKVLVTNVLSGTVPSLPKI